MIERIISRSHIVVAPTQLPCISREHADVEAGIECAREEGDGQFVVVGHVELVEAGTIAIGLGDLFDGVAAGCTESVGEVELGGYFGDREFAVFVVDFIYADGGKADWGGDWE